jgi:hypothetical protein
VTYRPGFAGIHQGGLKNPSASKAEMVVAERAAKLMSKKELAEHLHRHYSRTEPHLVNAVEYFMRMTKKELMSRAVIAHVHAFNVRTDNYD